MHLSCGPTVYTEMRQVDIQFHKALTAFIMHSAIGSSHPLSELLGEGLASISWKYEFKENALWNRKIVHMIGDTARKRIRIRRE